MKVDVCGLPFELKEVEDSSRTDMNMGLSDTKSMKITINKSMPSEMKEQVLIHEWLHCVLDNYSFDETNDEKLVQTLASELYRNGFRIKTTEEK